MQLEVRVAAGGDHRLSLLKGDVVRAAESVVAAFEPEGIAVWQNNGIPAHQSVPHVHVHVAGTLPEGGTNWGDVDRHSVTETDAIATSLRPHLRNQHLPPEPG